MVSKLQNLNQELAKAAIELAAESQEAALDLNAKAILSGPDGMLDIRVLAEFYRLSQAASDDRINPIASAISNAFGPIAIASAESLLLDYLAFAKVNSLACIAPNGIPSFAGLQAAGSQLISQFEMNRWNEYAMLLKNDTMRTLNHSIQYQRTQLAGADLAHRLVLSSADFSKTYQNQATRALQSRKAEANEVRFFKQFLPTFMSWLESYGGVYVPRLLLNQTLRQSEQLNGQYLSKSIPIEDFHLTPSQLAFREYLGEYYVQIWPGIFDGTWTRNSFDRWNRVQAHSTIYFPYFEVLALPMGMSSLASSIHAEYIYVPIGDPIHGTSYLSYAQPVLRVDPFSADFYERVREIYATHSFDIMRVAGICMLVANYGLTLFASVQKSGSGNVKPAWTGTPLNQATIAHFELAMTHAMLDMEMTHAR